MNSRVRSTAARFGVIAASALAIVVAAASAPYVIQDLRELDMAGQREILAEGETFEAIVGEDAAKVGVAREHDPVHVVDFALEPAGDRPQARHARHRSDLVGPHMHPNAVVAGQRQQAIDDLEPIGPLRIVDPRDLHQLLIFQPRRVAQRLQRGGQPVAVDEQRHLADLVLRTQQHVAEHVLGALDHAVVRRVTGG